MPVLVKKEYCIARFQQSAERSNNHFSPKKWVLSILVKQEYCLFWRCWRQAILAFRVKREYRVFSRSIIHDKIEERLFKMRHLLLLKQYSFFQSFIIIFISWYEISHAAYIIFFVAIKKCLKTIQKIIYVII